MKIIPYDESKLLKTGEGNIDAAFRKVERWLPLPRPVKHMVLNLMTYILCM